MKNIEICVRAVIKSRGRILLCWHKEKKYHFLPGGHMEFGETAKRALIRELKEELDIVVKNLFFIGVIENIYKEEKEKHRGHRGKHHEINLVFNVLVERTKDKSLEDHIDFVFLSKKDFARKKIFPITLKKAVIEWLKNKRTFWIAEK